MRKFTLLAALLIAACNPAANAPSSRQVATGAQQPWTKGAMVAAANPHAVAAAIEILKRGGNAVDAAIAAHTVLGLVEPQSSGLGGGGFMIVYDRADDSLSVYDGRETAPAGATEDMFMRDGKPLGFLDAWQSGLSVGVPGVVAMYRLAHDDHGKLPWSEVFTPAIRLAEQGFEVSPRLADMLPRMARSTRLDDNPATAAYFFPGGEPLKAGQLLRNPAYAQTLERLADEGISAFYTGAIARQIASAAQAEPNGGSLTVADLEHYKAIRRKAVCGKFRDTTICGAPPPSSGALQIMIADLYDHLAADATDRNEKVRAFVDAQRLGYADRDYFFADPDFVPVPLGALLDPGYLKHRAGERFLPEAVPTHGDPGINAAQAAVIPIWGMDMTTEIGGTTHFSIVDQYGNAVSMTASIEAPFGSSRWSGGFLLNNELTDFSRQPASDGHRVANAVAPGKRPRSSMSPILVFDGKGELLMVSGSPGGNSIPAYVAKTTIGILDWGLTAQQAVDYPNIVARGQTVRVETVDPVGEQLAQSLERMGYPVRESRGEISGIHLIVVRSDRLEGAADKRREGRVETLH